MAERKHITLVYQYNDNWIGGTYYIHNIIRSLKLLPDEEKPALLILHDINSGIDVIKNFNYPYISFLPFNFKLGGLKKLANKFSRFFIGKKLFKLRLPAAVGNNVYPLATNMSNKNIGNGYYWIPDFQEYYLPHFFSKLEVYSRKAINKEMVTACYPIVFSSKTAAADFDKFYPGNKNKKRILSFTSFIDTSYKEIPLTALLQKHNITKPYFIVANQFWKHKNHFAVLKALRLLKEHAFAFQVVFTGKESDYRNPDYFSTIKKYIRENDLEKQVLFLGFIDRQEQLQLMANAIAIIQPSLFEGWSTVVEDAKVLNQFILVSDIPIHKEQVKDNAFFFDPLNENELADKMLFMLQNEKAITSIDYSSLQQQFAQQFIQLFTDQPG
jgi:glycosyltransferase involved in cell wall biosynthesis